MTETSVEKVNLLGLTLPKMEAFCLSIGEKKFRGAQLVKWIHQQGVTDFDQMTNLSKSFRDQLKSIAEVRPPRVTFQGDSTDGTRKWLMEVDGGSKIETVYIPDGDRGTLCVSSQVGCSLDCSFCSTGKQGFNKNLTAAEIIGQVFLAAKSFGLPVKDSQKRSVTNVVMMGMGEPLLNFEPVVDAMALMLEDQAYCLSKRRVTLSTSGVVPNLNELAKVTDVALAVSLHAPNDALRNELVPINRKYPIAVLFDSIRNYLDGLSDNRSVTFEYTMLKGVNDSDALAHELSALAKTIRCKINLIPFNPFPGTDYEVSSRNRIYAFQRILLADGHIVTVRKTRGDDIDAACGQLAGQVADKTKRSARYIQLQDVTAQLDQVPH
ncbi:MAG: 23S rRNA (adenine(2503)-C(2))-methyltransferase RlmN [Litoricola sp.]|jgi:23S rRNA (adenine2503-C2)-methyltransferase|nr:23S rRNA (adenine(2503)-C(2))-methyltransferase RlmN [Litorivicinus sp.]MBT6288638.1 23S rRNA (adenine(2503)-C(2))-methyltransferase RlmN [Oceanospirillales bacterium]MDB2403332.1 23S rRNA (adenine(2503)-C(2))-methyltransferase RlmN [Litorivicinaceae bacterium]HAB67895.1 23S rRNA (adenine(2503)-C(2))-methyltransferase RlmN [Gammaproteobacteria bacterium]MBL6808968.1 23S rRNA (adenine(2503)-C(2))-methyltransferase RlmN [Litorivicinus sp.]